tara:strand:+ start:37 stop:1383 length:1347 start_codon:yes stop_codon:yes gene_type:complete
MVVNANRTGNGNIKSALDLIKLDYKKLGDEAGRYISFFQNTNNDPNYAKIKYEKPKETTYSFYQAAMCFKLYYGVLESKYKKFITGLDKREEIVMGDILTDIEGTLNYSICIGNLSTYVDDIIDFELKFKMDSSDGSISIPDLEKDKIINNSCEKFNNILKYLKKNMNKRIVISSQFTTQGCYLLSAFLGAVGFKHLYLNHKLPTADRLRILDLYNQEKFNTIIIDKSAAEGISFLRVSELHFLDPIYNMALRDQIIARGVRYKSHEGIEKPEVKVYFHTSVMMLGSTAEASFKEAITFGAINNANSLRYGYQLKNIINDKLKGYLPRTNWWVYDTLMNPVYVLFETGLTPFHLNGGPIENNWLDKRITPDNLAMSTIAVQEAFSTKFTDSILERNILSKNYQIPKDCISLPKQNKIEAKGGDIGYTRKRSSSNNKKKSLKRSSKFPL